MNVSVGQLIGDELASPCAVMAESSGEAVTVSLDKEGVVALVV